MRKNLKKHVKHIKSHAKRIKKRTREIYDKFDNKDIAQMLTSVFVILQVFTGCTVNIVMKQSLLLVTLSVLASAIIIWIVMKRDFIKHIIAGIAIVALFSYTIGSFMGASIDRMLIAFAVGLPVATTVNILRK